MIIRKEKHQIEPYLRDASNFSGFSEIVYVPENIDELKQAVAECYQNKHVISISGAGTGLAGGRVPVGGAVISTELLNKIIEIDTESKTVKVEPGVTLEQLENELNALGFFYPPNPTERNSSIGGNIATNASGARTLKYGSTRDFVTGLSLLLVNGDEIKLKRGEVVAQGYKVNIPTESGRTIKLNIPEIYMPDLKHAAGYYLRAGMDAIDLFIGSEGTLALVTEIELKFLPLPEAVLGGIVFFNNDDELFAFLDFTRAFANSRNTDNVISPRLLEYFDSNSLELLREKYPNIPENCAGAVWYEQEYDKDNEDKVLMEWSDTICKFSSLGDLAWIAMTDTEHKRQREFRHAMPLHVADVISRNGQRKVGTDTAVPEKHFRNYYNFVKSRLEYYNLDYVIFGHFGNCHIHANALPKTAEEYETGMKFYGECITEAIRLGGTVSAEHGIGKIKRNYFSEMFGEQTTGCMFVLKKVFDPENLLGRGNLFNPNWQ